MRGARLVDSDDMGVRARREVPRRREDGKRADPQRRTIAFLNAEQSAADTEVITSDSYDRPRPISGLRPRPARRTRA